MAKKFECDDGFMVQSNNENEVVEMVMQHMKKYHPNMSASRQDILPKIKDV